VSTGSETISAFSHLHLLIPIFSFFRFVAELVKSSSQQYSAARTVYEKMNIADAIVHRLIQKGRFLKHDKNLKSWVAISDVDARKKVSQALQYRVRRSNGGKT
jgi:hypothetical protein